MYTKNKKVSINRFYWRIILFMIPVILFAAIISLYVRKSTSRQMLDSMNGNIKNQIRSLDKSFESVSKSVMNLLSDNEELKILQNSDNIYERNTANMRLQSTFQDLRSYFSGEYNYFYFDARNGLIMPAALYVDYAVSRSVGSSIENYIQTSREADDFYIINKRWKLLQADNGTWFCLKIYRNHQSYVGCWVTIDYIERQFAVNQYSSTDQYLFLVQNGEILTNISGYQRIAHTRQLIVNRDKTNQISGNYEVAWYDFDKGDFSLVFVSNIFDGYRNVIRLLIVLILFIVLIIGIGVWLLVYIKKKLLNPINAFVSNLSITDMSEESPPYFEELELVNRLFFNAQKQIQELKIDIYEKELERQNVEIESLQMQVRPHFFLNCLNIFYSLAQSGKLNEIKELSIDLSDYLRYLFRNGSSPVTVGEEINHVIKYLNISKIRYDNEFVAEFLVAEELKGYLIPALILQILVENSIKHALFSRSIIIIRISANLVIKDGDFLYFRVYDNGPGYSPKVLITLQNNEDLTTKDGKRIGLKNIRQRLKFYYGDRAKIKFSNIETGGAMTEIWIPAE